MEELAYDQEAGGARLLTLTALAALAAAALAVAVAAVLAFLLVVRPPEPPPPAAPATPAVSRACLEARAFEKEVVLQAASNPNIKAAQQARRLARGDVNRACEGAG